jgi:hypothetical protein
VTKKDSMVGLLRLLVSTRLERAAREALAAEEARGGWQIPASMVPPPPDTFTRRQVEVMLHIALTVRTDEWTTNSVDERVATLLAMFAKEKP